MKYRNKVVAFILIAMVALLGTTGCFKTAKKTVMGNVTGKVYDSNGKALHRAKIAVYGTGLVTESDELGRYALNGVSPGQAKLTATFEDKSVVRVVEIKRGETIEGIDLTFEVIDRLPPIITGVTVAELSENAVTINWVTDELSNSIVDYATGPVGLGTYNNFELDTNMVLEHSITISGLLPGQIYHFRCRSVDFTKNEGVSSDYQFTTAKGAAPGAPQEVALTIFPEQEKLLLSWRANEEEGLRGYYLYRSNGANMPFLKVATIEAAATSYLDEGLVVGQKYYYKLSAYDLAMNESEASEVVSGVTPGILTENRTWRRLDSPYIIAGDVRVRSGAVLTVEPGVEVRFTQRNLVPDSQGGEIPSLLVQGALYAVGTEQQPIVFTSAEKAPRIGSWGGLHFMGTTSAHNVLRHVTVMFAEVGANCEGSLPSIEESEFGFCGVGMSLGMTSSMSVRYNLFQDCDIGLISAGSHIRNNLFVDNQLGAALLGEDTFEYNTLDCLIGVQVDFGSPVIKNNIIARTRSTRGIYGISQTTAEAWPRISYNNIHNYAITFNEVTTDTSAANIEEDPSFVGGFPYDYRLQEGSVCLTADEEGGELGRYHEDS